MKLFSAAALALLLTSGVAFAQTDGGNSNSGTDGSASQSGGNADGGGNYLTGDGPGQFYTDKSMGTLKSEGEVKSTYEGLSQAERDSLKQSCQGNKDTRWSALCNSIGAM